MPVSAVKSGTYLPRPPYAGLSHPPERGRILFLRRRLESRAPEDGAV